MLLLSALLVGSSCSRQEDAQTATAASADNAGAKRNNAAESNAPQDVLNAVESLVAPVALYPDPLLAELLIAATYPQEIALAARRLETGAIETVAGKQNLDTSIARLERLPPVIIMLKEHPQWTADLGEVFLAEPETLLQAIQTLRGRALQAGLLKDSTAQKVLSKTVSTASSIDRAAEPGSEKSETSTREIIIILPAELQKIHVPLYDPETVFSASLAVQSADSGGKKASAQQSLSDDTGAEETGGYYPAYYPLSSQSADNGSKTMAFDSGTAVNGLLTWGQIEWSTVRGYSIDHRYGKLVTCNGSDDCWLRSEDKGYLYTDGYVENALESGAADANSALSTVIDHDIALNAWYHDPRHRRGLRYSENAAKQLTDFGPPPLAGQRFSASAQPLRDRGFDVIAPADETEAGAPFAADHLSLGVRDSLLSGVDAAENGEVEEIIQQGGDGRDSHQTAAPQQDVVHLQESRKSGSKSLVKLAMAQPETSRALQMQQQHREDVLPSAFDGIRGNARLTGQFSRRGAESRNNNKELLLKYRGASRAASRQTRDEGD